MAAFQHRLRVRFQDTDPAGIVFFANVLVYCHEAYEELMRQGGMPLEEWPARRRQALPLGHAEVDFKRPLRAGQLVRVDVLVGRLGDRSYRLEYQLFGENDECVATAATVHISVDLATGQSIGIAPELRDLLEKYKAG